MQPSTKQNAFMAAQKFKRGRGTAWAWISDHEMIIDAECMDQVRVAHGMGGKISNEEIMEFRKEFVACIAKEGFV